MDELSIISDGSFDLNENVVDIIFYQSLNVFLVITANNKLSIFDPNTCQKLSSISLGKVIEENENFTTAIGCSGGIFICDSFNVGLRSDHQGVLLLNSILQTQIQNNDRDICLELLAAEAAQLHHVLSELPNVKNCTQVKDALSRAMTDVASPVSNPKIDKWRTVSLRLSHSILREMCPSLISEVRPIPHLRHGLSLASALGHRLSRLLENNEEIERMFSEVARLESFKAWPHMDYKWVLPAQMAQAGFYHNPEEPGDDRAVCFSCNVCLAYWEPTDEPWSEHERHSPNCPFVKGEYTINVPLSVTHSTGPAIQHECAGKGRKPYVSCSNSSSHMATASETGKVVLWNTSKQLKREVAFFIDPSDSIILDKHFSATVGYTDIPLKPPESSQNHSELSKGSKNLYGAFRVDEVSSDSVPAIIPNSVSIKSNIENEKVEWEEFQVEELYSPKEEGWGDFYSNELSKLGTNEEKEILGVNHWGNGNVNSIVDSSEASNKRNENMINMNMPKSAGLTELFSPPRPSHDVRLSSLCIVEDHAGRGSNSSHGKPSKSCLIVGVGLKKYNLFGLKDPTLDCKNASNNYKLNNSDEIICNGDLNTNHEDEIDIIDLESDKDAVKVIIDSTISDIDANAQSDDSCVIADETIIENKFDGGSINKNENDNGVKLPKENFSTNTAKFAFANNSLSDDHVEIGMNDNKSVKMDETFAAYLLVYDLCPFLIGENRSPARTKCTHGTSKKSSKKASGFGPPHIQAAIAYSKMKGELLSVPHKIRNKYSKEIMNAVRKSSKKPPKCVQCIPLPNQGLKVDIILTDPSGEGIFVSMVEANPSNDGETNHAQGSEPGYYGAAILFKVENVNNFLSISEQPLLERFFRVWGLVPKHITLIPSVSGENESMEYLSCVCNDGRLRILSTFYMEYVWTSVKDAFISSVYCNSLERLCGVCADGSVHLFNVIRRSDPGDENINFDMLKQNENNIQDSRIGNLSPKYENFLINSPITETSLDQCLLLTRFTPGCPHFIATLPPCWTEIIQAQKMRRNPQHLQQQMDDIDMTRTWKLEPDETSNDGHLFDILIQRSTSSRYIQVGHIDVKLNFLPGYVGPLSKIQVTLLWQNLKDPLKSTSYPITDTNSTEFYENPVHTREFLLKHRAEILCGPITISNCIDLSGHVAHITLTSPLLFACKGRSFLIHIKALRSNEYSQTSGAETCGHLNLVGKYLPPANASFLDKLSATAQKKTRSTGGCDIIQEISITVHCSAKTDIPHERLQRLSLLDNSSFHLKLLEVVISKNTSLHLRMRALDLFLWVLSVHTAHPSPSLLCCALITMVSDNLDELVKVCMLGQDRAAARKTLKILITVLESFKEVNLEQPIEEILTLQSPCKATKHEIKKHNFGSKILNSVLKSLDTVWNCNSSGSLDSFFSLLNHVKWTNATSTANSIQNCLDKALAAISHRTDPLQSVLNSKFCLYGTPLNRDIYDVSPQIIYKTPPGVNGPGNSTNTHVCPNSQQPGFNNTITHVTMSGPSSGNKLVSQHKMNAVANKYQVVQGPNGQKFDYFLGMNGKIALLGSLLYENDHVISDSSTSLESFKGISQSLTPQAGGLWGLCGLLEVEPLHFSLYMASDGTRMERVTSCPSYPVASCLIPSNLNMTESENVSKKIVKEEISVKYKEPDESKEDEAQQANLSLLSDLINMLDEKPNSKNKTKEHIESVAQESAELKAEMDAALTVLSLEEPEKCINSSSSSSFSSSSSSTNLRLSSDEDIASPDNSLKKPDLTRSGYQQLLSLPPQQVLVTDRMYSGARRFVVLDFGAPVVLTDVVIPACSDLVSITLDFWLTGEEIDGERLAVVSDIGLRPLVLTDLQPPPLCRYLKITTLGRVYGMISSPCRIPVGAFYGHTLILPWHVYSAMHRPYVTTPGEAKLQLNALGSLWEDLSSRYSLAASKLRSSINSLCKGGDGAQTEQKVKTDYEGCMMEQQHLNIVSSLIKRLQIYLEKSSPLNENHAQKLDDEISAKSNDSSLYIASNDKLSTVMQYLLNCLLSMSHLKGQGKVFSSLVSWCTSSRANALLDYACLRGNRGVRIAIISLLARICPQQAWWGEFMAGSIERLFSGRSMQDLYHFPDMRIFSFVAFLGQKSVECGYGVRVIEAVMKSLTKQLQLEESSSNSSLGSWLIGNSFSDDQQICWLLLFLSISLDALGALGNDVEKGKEGRWLWLRVEPGFQTKSCDPQRCNAPKATRERLKKRLDHHRKQLVDLETATKKFGVILAGIGNSLTSSASAQSSGLFKHQTQMFKRIQKQHALKHFKDLCSIRRHETRALGKMQKATNLQHSGQYLATAFDPVQANALPPSPYDSIACFNASPHLIKNNIKAAEIAGTNAGSPQANSSKIHKKHSNSSSDTLDACNIYDSLKNSMNNASNNLPLFSKTPPNALSTDFSFNSSFGTKSVQLPDSIHISYKKILTPIDNKISLAVCYGLLNWMSNSDYPCNVDSFLIACKVVAGLSRYCRPCLSLGELFQAKTLERMLSRCLYRGKAHSNQWVMHALSCLILDLLEGEHLYGSSQDASQSSDQDDANSPSNGSDDTGFDQFEPSSNTRGSTVEASSDICSFNDPNLDKASQLMSKNCKNDSTWKQTGGDNPNVRILEEKLLSSISGGKSDKVDLGDSLVEDEFLETMKSIVEREKLTSDEMSAKYSVFFGSQAAQSAISSGPPVVKVATSHNTTLQFDYDEVSDLDSDSEEMGDKLMIDVLFNESQQNANQENDEDDAFSVLYDAWSIKDIAQKPQKGSNDSQPTMINIAGRNSDQSTGIDSRLENGVSLLAEVRLRMMKDIQSEHIREAVSAPIKSIIKEEWVTENIIPDPVKMTEATLILLRRVFHSSIMSFNNNKDLYGLESLLELWLKINNEAPEPIISMTIASIRAILKLVVRSPYVSVRCWCLVLQALTLILKMTWVHEDDYDSDEVDDEDKEGMNSDHNYSLGTEEKHLPDKLSLDIIKDINFIPLMLKLLSENHSSGQRQCGMVGPTLCQHFDTFLAQLQLCCASQSESNYEEAFTLYSALFKVISRMLEPSGAFSLQIGPLDAQKCLLDTFLCFELVHWPKKDLHLLRTILKDTISIVSVHLSSGDFVPRLTNNEPSPSLGSLFASSSLVQSPFPTFNSLLCSLVTLSRTIVTIITKQGVNLAREEVAQNKIKPEEKFKVVGCTHSEVGKSVRLADSIVEDDGAMQSLLLSLGSCEGSSICMILGAAGVDVNHRLGIGDTLTDALYQLSLQINLLTTKPKLVVSALVKYLRNGDVLDNLLLSEPLFCYFGQVLDCNANIETFNYYGGIKLLWQVMTRSVGMLWSSKKSLVSSVMKHLNVSLPNTRLTEDATNSKKENQDKGSSKSSLFNFGPLSTITSSNPTARPADSLIQSSQFLQRSKTPPWSYHFYPDEEWVDLILTFPCPILLHEVHLLPHAISLGMSPSSISLECSVGSTFLMPCKGLIPTMGLTAIKLLLPKPTVASTLVIRLHRPRDQSTVGLTQVRVMGTTFDNNEIKDASDGRCKTSFWCLRTLEHLRCTLKDKPDLTLVAGTTVPGVMMGCIKLLLSNYQPQQELVEATTLALANSSDSLMEALVQGLFCHPIFRQTTGNSNIELALSLLFELCTTLNGESGTCGIILMLNWLELVVGKSKDNICHQMRNTMYPNICSSAKSLWVEQITNNGNVDPCVQTQSSEASRNNLNLKSSLTELTHGLEVNSQVLNCIAAILWNTKHNIKQHLTRDLFDSILYVGTFSASSIKLNLEKILCAMCNVNSKLFTYLLLRTNICFEPQLEELVNEEGKNDNNVDDEPSIWASCTDDMKKFTDKGQPKRKQTISTNNTILNTLTASDLETLAVVAQTPVAIQLLLESGFPLVIVRGIKEWCLNELNEVSLEESATDYEKSSASKGQFLGDARPLPRHMIPHALSCLSALASELTMKSWLGSKEGSQFWTPLFTILGGTFLDVQNRTFLSGKNIIPDHDPLLTRIEDETIYFMKRITENHQTNQERFATAVCNLVQKQRDPPQGGLTYIHSLSDFTRRLVLQILLETERILVNVVSPIALSQPPCLAFAEDIAMHPKFGVGSRSRLLYLPVSTKMEEIVKMVTDFPPIGDLSNVPSPPPESNLEGDPSSHRELGEVGLELVDKLSVAAGVMAAGVSAKEKRCRFGWNRTAIRGRNKDDSSESKLNAPAENPQNFPSIISSNYGILHRDLCTTCLPSELTLGQLMMALDVNNSKCNRQELTLHLSQNKDSLKSSLELSLSLLSTNPLPSSLQIFTKMGGLSILAHHMTMLYPDTSYQQVINSIPMKNMNDVNKDMDKTEMEMYMDNNDMEMYVENMVESANDSNHGYSDYVGMYEQPSANKVGGSALSYIVPPPIPPHALGAFTLFLRLPGYAETLLLDSHKASRLLRLALGVKDGMSHDPTIHTCTVPPPPLASLPFQALHSLLETTPLNTDDGRLLRAECVNSGALHLVLALVTALSHHARITREDLWHPDVPISLVVASTRSLVIPKEEMSANLINKEQDKSNYWAKGTGFGTGSTTQTWNVDLALHRQKMQEHHIVWLMRILGQYVNPGDILVDEISSDTFIKSTLEGTEWSNYDAVREILVFDQDRPPLPKCLFQLFLNSGLIDKVSSYLSNDSVLDMSRHVPLYRSLMSLVRGIAITKSLTPLLIGSKDCNYSGQSSKVNILDLLAKMDLTVNTYITKLKWKSGINFRSRSKKEPKAKCGNIGVSSASSQCDFTSVEMEQQICNSINKLHKHIKSVQSGQIEKIQKFDDSKVLGQVKEETENEIDDSESEEGLSLLIPDIRLTAMVVEECTLSLLFIQSESSNTQEEFNNQLSQETDVDTYIKQMQPLQFDSYEMQALNSNGQVFFTVPYHFSTHILLRADQPNEVPSNLRRMKRLAQEHVTLSTSLPLSKSSSVFVRTDPDRLDIMKVLITGPEETPYANGCFEFDVFFPANYPNSPLFINLQTTGEKKVRFNPNLYQDGKVCLSILNTWHGRPEEKWNSRTSSLLQVLVSIQSLILVSEPYFNEPGFERSRGTATAIQNSKEYDANIRCGTVRWAIINQIRNASPCFKEVVHNHFWLKQKEILSQVRGWIEDFESLLDTKRSWRNIQYHLITLKKLYPVLKDELSRLPTPKGLEHIKIHHDKSDLDKSDVIYPSMNKIGATSNVIEPKIATRKKSKADLLDGEVMIVEQESNAFLLIKNKLMMMKEGVGTSIAEPALLPKFETQALNASVSVEDDKVFYDNFELSQTYQQSSDDNKENSEEIIEQIDDMSHDEEMNAVSDDIKSLTFEQLCSNDVTFESSLHSATDAEKLLISDNAIEFNLNSENKEQSDNEASSVPEDIGDKNLSEDV